ISKLTAEFSDDHAKLYELIARNDQVMSTYALECASDVDNETVAQYLGDLVRASYVKIYQKHGRRPAWEVVKAVAKAS
ncbi:MAG: hypothetical protein DRQ47_04145, partial [Gammaproteobacteria bacterium]